MYRKSGLFLARARNSLFVHRWMEHCFTGPFLGARQGLHSAEVEALLRALRPRAQILNLVEGACVQVAAAVIFVWLSRF